MLRACSLFAVVELALIAICIGAPNAYADPAEECCSNPRHAECSGCLNGYNLGAGELYGCWIANQAPGCSLSETVCNEVQGKVARYVIGSNCAQFKEWSGGVVITKDGCMQTYCD